MIFAPRRCQIAVALVVVGALCPLPGSVLAAGSSSASSCSCASSPVGATITHGRIDAVTTVARATVLYDMTKISQASRQPTNYFMVRTDAYYKNDIGVGQIMVKTISHKSCQGPALVKGQRYILFGSIQDEVVPDYAGRVPVFALDGCQPQKAASALAFAEWQALHRYSPAPSAGPSPAPSGAPFAAPSTPPTTTPTEVPTTAPTTSPSTAPESSPSTSPTTTPATSPSTTPTSQPTVKPESFEIYLDATKKVPAADKKFFQVAANRWQSVIRGGLPDVTSANLGPAPAGCKYPTVIDDLYLCATYDHIASDGPGKFVGFALPVYWRLPSYIPLAGFISLDSADTSLLRSRGLFTRTILHELGHVLGIGTQWERTKLTGNMSNGCPYHGPKANAEYKALTGCASVPTELDGGVGTHCQHWDEVCLGDELMTGYLGGRTQLSRLTIAGLEDLGYEVDYANSDYLGRDDINPTCMCKTRRELFDEPDFISASTESAATQQQSPPRQLRHGDVTLLSHAPMTGHRRRKLSAAGHEQAMVTGQAILEKLKEQHDQAQTPPSTEFEFAGDQVVSVIMIEDGNIYGVIVEPTDDP